MLSKIHQTTLRPNLVPPIDEVEGAEGGEEQQIEVRYEHPVKWPVRPREQLVVNEGTYSPSLPAQTLNWFASE